MKIIQNLSNLVGINEEVKNEYLKAYGNPKVFEVLTMSEVEKIDSLFNHELIGTAIKEMLWNGELELPEMKTLISLLNRKRIFIFNDRKGEKRFVILPHLPAEIDLDNGTLNYRASLLIKAGLRYQEYLHCQLEDKDTVWNKFENLLYKIKLDITKQVFSKEFKQFYQMKFRGISGVALTGNLEPDEIELPYWYAKKNNLKKGDLVLVTRDPIQNLVLAGRIAGFTRNECRVNSNVFTWLGGDHDGDKVQFIPLSVILEENSEFIEDSAKLEEELIAILPTNVVKRPELATLLEYRESSL